MNTLTGNRYDPKTGLLQGDHLRFLAKIGIHKLIQRVNNTIQGCDHRLGLDDLPGKVRALVEKADKLADQLEKCDAIDLSMAKDYITAQTKIAGDALPLLQEILQRQENAAKQAVEQLRITLTGKGGPAVSAAADVLLRNLNVAYAAEHELALPFWRAVFAICRDNANTKATPRWLVVMIAQHEAHKAGMVAAG